MAHSAFPYLVQVPVTNHFSILAWKFGADVSRFGYPVINEQFFLAVRDDDV